MPSPRIVKAIDIFEDRYFSMSPCFPRASPDQFSLDRFEERLNGSVAKFTLGSS
jgi:hypothetical protein